MAYTDLLFYKGDTMHISIDLEEYIGLTKGNHSDFSIDEMQILLIIINSNEIK